jgi:aspartyl-tRNA(Asn)/glutamyl-tRNA(Gln) amidotransferase subunit A
MSLFCCIIVYVLKHTQVSRHGLIAYSSSLDCPGIMTRSVADAALLLDCLASSTPDHRDSMSAIAPPHVFPPNDESDNSFMHNALKVVGEMTHNSRPLTGMVVGIPREYSVEGLHESGKSAWLSAMSQLEALGAEVVSVSVPSVTYALPAYYVLACAEASSNLSRYDGLRYGKGVEDVTVPLHEAIMRARSDGFGAEVQRRILCGTFVLGASSYAS